jgi:hypothetical protein
VVSEKERRLAGERRPAVARGLGQGDGALLAEELPDLEEELRGLATSR